MCTINNNGNSDCFPVCFNKAAILAETLIKSPTYKAAFLALTLDVNKINEKNIDPEIQKASYVISVTRIRDFMDAYA